MSEADFMSSNDTYLPDKWFAEKEAALGFGKKSHSYMTGDDDVAVLNNILKFATKNHWNSKNIKAIKNALAVLCGNQPDPITGLMPCGCGGEVVRYGRNLLNRFTTGCSECGTLSWSEFSQEDADKNWNNSRGYRDL